MKTLPLLVSKKLGQDLKPKEIKPSIHLGVGAAVCFSPIFFSEVLNLNKFLRIVFIFLRILGDFE